MRLVIDLNLDKLPNDQAKEAIRILRYWAGWMPQMDLTKPSEHALMDSDYQVVGTLRLLEENAAESSEGVLT